jgi:hypothetical protein
VTTETDCTYALRSAMAEVVPIGIVHSAALYATTMTGSTLAWAWDWSLIQGAVGC